MTDILLDTKILLVGLIFICVSIIPTRNEVEIKKLIQPSGPSSKDKCSSYDGTLIDCPEHTTDDNDMMWTFMEECREVELRGNTYGVTCVFFPLVYNSTTNKLESCHKQKEYSQYPCSYGFRIRPTRQHRRGNADDAFITVQFFGKIPPFEVNGGNNHSGFDVAEWLALGISPNDKIMGDDLVIYCHPYMDRNLFPLNDTDENPLYPEDIGVAINKYFTKGNGQQAYDAERKFNGRQGEIKAGRVVYWPGVDKSKPSWGILDCKADISTYILLKSRQELFTGIELDMERQKHAYVFMASGHCLHQECIGDHPNNTEELAEVARRTSIMAYHKSWDIFEDQVELFQAIDRKENIAPVLRLQRGVLGLGIISLTFVALPKSTFLNQIIT